MDNKTSPKSVAIVGSGPAGLICAYLLQIAGCNVTLFESSSKLAMVGHSYETADGQNKIDIPMRVFSGKYYTNFRKLLDHLHIESVKRNFIFAFSMKNRRTCRPHLYHASNFHRRHILYTPYASWLAIIISLFRLFYVGIFYAWFSFACCYISPRVEGERGCHQTETLMEYLHRIQIPDWFVHLYILPVFSSVASSTHEDLLRYPAHFVTNYKRETNGYSHLTMPSVQDLVEKLSQDLEVHFSARVIAIVEQKSGIEVKTKSAEGFKTWTFDAVVLATNPESIYEMHEPSRTLTKELFTRDVIVTVHQDKTWVEHMQWRDSFEWLKLDKTSSEVLALQTQCHPLGTITDATHIINSNLFTTVQLVHKSQLPIATSYHSARFKRFVPSVDSYGVLKRSFASRLRTDTIWRNGTENVWIIGGWAWDGLPLLEGCVYTACRTVLALGFELPFELESHSLF